MSVKIHPQSIVSDKAQLSSGVEVGPFSIIEDNVEIGANTKIGPHVLITGFTSIGKNCQVFKGAVLGSQPQDLKYSGEKSYLQIGDSNVIREFVTANPGTDEESKTIIGNNNLIMAYSHIAHDCNIGNYCVLANAATLAGHVELADNVVIGGLVAVHQFCRLGRLSIVGGCSKVVQDVPPFAMADGHPVQIKGVNLIGLKRNKISSEILRSLKQAFKILFFQKHNLGVACRKAEEKFGNMPEIKLLLEFIKTSSRGISK